MKLIYRVISLIMSFLVVFSTTGVVISKHICDGEIKDIAWFEEATPCEHSTSSQAVECPVHENMIYVSEMDSGCCEDTKDYIRDNNPQIEVKSGISLNYQPVILYLVSYILFQINPNYTTHLKNLQLKIPPLINQKIPVLIQSFLL